MGFRPLRCQRRSLASWLALSYRSSPTLWPSAVIARCLWYILLRGFAFGCSWRFAAAAVMLVTLAYVLLGVFTLRLALADAPDHGGAPDSRQAFAVLARILAALAHDGPLAVSASQRRPAIPSYADLHRLAPDVTTAPSPPRVGRWTGVAAPAKARPARPGWNRQTSADSPALATTLAHGPLRRLPPYPPQPLACTPGRMAPLRRCAAGVSTASGKRKSRWPDGAHQWPCPAPGRLSSTTPFWAAVALHPGPRRLLGLVGLKQPRRAALSLLGLCSYVLSTQPCSNPAPPRHRHSVASPVRFPPWWERAAASGHVGLVRWWLFSLGDALGHRPISGPWPLLLCGGLPPRGHSDVAGDQRCRPHHPWRSAILRQGHGALIRGFGVLAFAHVGGTCSTGLAAAAHSIQAAAESLAPCQPGRPHGAKVVVFRWSHLYPVPCNLPCCCLMPAYPDAKRCSAKQSCGTAGAAYPFLPACSALSARVRALLLGSVAPFLEYNEPIALCRSVHKRREEATGSSSLSTSRNYGGPSRALRPASLTAQGWPVRGAAGPHNVCGKSNRPSSSSAPCWPPTSADVRVAGRLPWPSPGPCGETCSAYVASDGGDRQDPHGVRETTGVQGALYHLKRKPACSCADPELSGLLGMDDWLYRRVGSYSANAPPAGPGSGLSFTISCAGARMNPPSWRLDTKARVPRSGRCAPKAPQIRHHGAALSHATYPS